MCVNVFIDIDSDTNKKVSIRSKVKALNGKEMKTETVFVAAFKYLHKELKKGFEDEFDNLERKFKRKFNIDNIDHIRDIQWIVTVPAIWDDAAKDKMLKWINKAGLTDKNIPNHCILRYEPDCASLSLKHQILNKTVYTNDDQLFDGCDDIDNILMDTPGNTPGNNDTILSNKKYILIDSGGGTVDIACHQFFSDGVKELHHPSGGAWGDINVDKAFIKILSDILGNDLYNKIKKRKPVACFDLLDNLRLQKKKFSDVGDNQMVGIDFPNALHKQIRKEITIDKFIENVKKFEFNGHKDCFKYDEDSRIFFMKCKIWKKYLYNPLINKVIKHVKMLLSKHILRDCHYMYLVCGYSVTPYSQNKLINEFGLNSIYNIDVIVPPNPIHSVVDGAARMGLLVNKNEQYVKERVLTKD